jgi:tetraacyldisaccharide 4'-kinase
VIQAPAFWRDNGLPARALAPLGALYGAVARRRLRQSGAAASLPAIVVGGLTSGGDGKTPLVMALAQALQASGARPFVLARGYGRKRSAGRTPLPVDPDRHNADMVGDEARLLARLAPTIIGADRVAAAELARRLGATILLLDDGFHSRALRADLGLVVIDSAYGAGNGRCLPAGPLRAPLDAQLAAADAIILVDDAAPGAAIARSAGKPVIRARIAPEPTAAAALAGSRVVAFAGVGRPEKFFGALIGIGAQVVATRAFPDHHRFSTHDLDTLRALATAHDARLVTTDKDAARPGVSGGITTLPIRLAFDARDAGILSRLLVPLIGGTSQGDNAFTEARKSKED